MDVENFGKLKSYQGLMFGFDLWSNYTVPWLIYSQNKVANLPFDTNKVSACSQCKVSPSDLATGVKVTFQIFSNEISVLISNFDEKNF